jgi:hydroxyacylglutathione hydrolase
MYVEQLYTNCLAEAAYYIESNGEAAIIDPLRETSPYIELAESRNVKIKYIFETHFHADFVSGHVDLAKLTGATIIYGPTANPDYQVHVAKDEELFEIGNVKIKVLHTPGHTMESSCFLLLNEKDQPHAVFTGDTLFVGDVGRPDLAVKSELSQEDLAGLLYDSLNNKIKTLPDNTIVYPGHGAGSACGKNIGKETHTTIGNQKKFNYALQAKSKHEFIKAVTEGLSAPPAYFFHDAVMNMKGYDNIDNVLSKNSRKLTITEFEAELKKSDVVILDTRNPDHFEQGFIPGSINIGLNGQYAPWVGALISPNASLLLVTEKDKEQEAVLRLARIGYENVIGILEGGTNAWENAGNKLDKIESVSAHTLVEKLNDNINIIDVRKKGERESGVLEGAELICLSELENKLDTLKKDAKYYVHCAGGYRSMMAVSIMLKHGFKNLVNVHGGMSKINTTGVKLVIPEIA